MEAKYQLPVAILVSHILLLGYTATVSSAAVNRENAVNDNFGSPHPNALVYLGVVGEKTYFAEQAAMNNSVAATFCHAARLELASIESQAEADFLNQTLHEVELITTRGFWTSARQTLQPSTFLWNETETQVNSSFFNNWVTAGGEYFCIYYYPQADGNTTIGSTPCSVNMYVLCQA